MCDYSLMSVPNRLAQEGEELVVHRFTTGSIGLATHVEPDPGVVSPRRTFWSALIEFFSAPQAEPVLAVCIPPGATLLLGDIPKRLQRELSVGPTEEVMFTQTGPSYSHRDSVRFRNGRQILLQRLVAGQRVRVLALGQDDGGESPKDQERFSGSLATPISV